MDTDRQSVFSVIGDEYFVRDEACITSSSPNMPTLIPVEPRLADEPTPGVVQADRDNRKSSPTYNWMGNGFFRHTTAI